MNFWNAEVLGISYPCDIYVPDILTSLTICAPCICNFHYTITSMKKHHIVWWVLMAELHENPTKISIIGLNSVCLDFESSQLAQLVENCMVTNW